LSNFACKIKVPLDFLPGGCGGGTQSLSAVRQGPAGDKGDSGPTIEFLLSSREFPVAPAQEGRDAASPGSHELSQLLSVVPLPLTLSLGDPEVC